MTIKFLTPWGQYPANAIVTLDSATETQLVSSKVATTDTTGGVVWTAPATPLQQYQVTWSPQDGQMRAGPSQAPVSGGGIVNITADVTITSANAATYNGQTLVWSAAWTVTLSAGLPLAFGFAGRPPASGNASVAVTGGPTINGATSTITRTLASNVLFAVQGFAADTYAATGS